MKVQQDLIIRCQFYYKIFCSAEFNHMGNKTCCQLGNNNQNAIQRIDNIDYNPEILPQLSQPIKKILNENKPFQQQLKAQIQIVTKQYEKQFYQGPVDKNNRPQGYGKMYKYDGSLVISYFRQGISQGPSIFIFPDGSYYEGYLKNNRAQDQNGKYVSERFVYEGEFCQNAFNGHGKETGKQYTFQGQYIKGRRVKGILIWTQGQQNYQYQGEFNQDFQFQGQGILKQGNIGIYKGNFKKGKKEQKGIYEYINGMRYEGLYKNGLKHGTGTVYNFDNTIAYSGGFANDLPNGQGYIIENGRKIYAEFKDGLDVLTLL